MSFLMLMEVRWVVFGCKRGEKAPFLGRVVRWNPPGADPSFHKGDCFKPGGWRGVNTNFISAVSVCAVRNDSFCDADHQITVTRELLSRIEIHRPGSSPDYMEVMGSPFAICDAINKGETYVSEVDTLLSPYPKEQMV